MGAGEKPYHHHHQQMGSFNFLHHCHGRESKKKELRDVPKGCLGVVVGQGEKRQRFVIPVTYVNHPLFGSLLKEAEEEFGFDHDGPISIPCHVDEFRNVQDLIDRDCHDHHHHRFPFPWRHQAGCFRV